MSKVDAVQVGNEPFPKEIYVQHGTDGESHWITARETKEEVFDECDVVGEPGDRVAIYKLVRVVKMTKRVSVRITESKAPNVQ